ncbi:hypothetical protein H5410_055879 [Solanum commersonii]|uniref:MADS-box domain-containing protein n=1 Tax=Solanum commersonii TaxID=4109 RepID=A0A9J5WIS5_SOLCO|nr:hypothetical protein H5410_055879 [Solanum commersonii]
MLTSKGQQQTCTRRFNSLLIKWEDQKSSGTYSRSQEKEVYFGESESWVVKKISELSILCDIKACMIIYEGNYNHQLWPKDPNKVKEVINLYKNQLQFERRSKLGKTLSNYFENDQKKRAEIKVEKYLTWDSRFDFLSEKELQNLTGVVEKRMDKAKGKIELLKSMNVYIGSSSLSHQQIWDYNLMNQTTTL